MIDGHRITVVVPARDEARHVAAVVRTMPAFVDEVIVVDDGSRDATAAIAEAAGARVICHATSQGVGAAIAAGYRAARGDVIAVMAGDAQMDPKDLVRVVAPVVEGEADYVKGNRLRGWRSMPWTRLLGTAVLGKLTSLAIGVPLGDSQCGYTAIAAAALARIDLAAVWPRYGYPNDLLSHLAAAGCRIAEVAVRPVYRDEASGLRAHHVAVIAWLIARAAVRRRRGFAGYPRPRETPSAHEPTHRRGARSATPPTRV